jgi:hypothetical protein
MFLTGWFDLSTFNEQGSLGNSIRSSPNQVNKQALNHVSHTFQSAHKQSLGQAQKQTVGQTHG